MKKVLAYDNEEKITFKKIYEFLTHIELELENEYELTEERTELLNKAHDIIEEIANFFDNNDEEED